MNVYFWLFHCIVLLMVCIYVIRVLTINVANADNVLVVFLL